MFKDDRSCDRSRADTALDALDAAIVHPGQLGSRATYQASGHLIQDQVAPAPVTSRVSGLLPASLAGSRLWTAAFLGYEERQALHDAMTPAQTAKAHTDLVCEGAGADELFIIVDGWACRYSTTGDGGRQLPAVLLPGDIGNLDSLMLERVGYGVRTLSDATIVTLPIERVLALAAQHPGIARTFTWLALIENTILSKWLQTLGRRSARSGLAHLLCELSVRLGGAEEGESKFRCHLTQEQMADILGMTTIHLNRVLQQLRAERMVVTRYRTIILPDVSSLRQSCGFDRRYLNMDPPGTGTSGMPRGTT